jgi:hypothetical protein
MPEDWSEAEQALRTFIEELDLLISEDFLEAEHGTPYQPIIYHYTNVSGALGILQTGHLWFAERAHLNDPVEIRYGVNIARELFERAVNNRGIGVPKDIASHLQGEFNLGLAIYGFWIASFSFDDDDLSQWRSYADEGRGVCLGFSTDRLDMSEFTKSVPGDPTCLRFPVNYSNASLRKRMQTHVDRGLDLLERLNLSARDSYKPHGQALLYERDSLRAMNNGIYLNSFLSKHAAYSHEREYRLLVSGLRETISRCSHHRLRERKGEIVGYLDLPIPNWKQPGLLASVRLGPAASDELKDQIWMALIALGIPLPKIDKSDIPFRPAR